MALKTHKFARKPFYVDAARVTEENIEEVAAWCKGEVLTTDSGEKYVKVKVHRPLTDRQTEAHLGDWVLFAGSGFKVYVPNAFDKSFEKVKQVEGKKGPVPTAPKRPRKPANPVLSEEDAAKLQHDNRDAKTGRFVSDEYASANPDTTVTESNLSVAEQQKLFAEQQADALIDEILNEQ